MRVLVWCVLILMNPWAGPSVQAQSRDGQGGQDGPESKCESQVSPPRGRMVVTVDGLTFTHFAYSYQLSIQNSAHATTSLVNLPQDAQRVCSHVVYLELVKAFVFATEGGGVYLVDAQQAPSVEGGSIETLGVGGISFQVVDHKPRQRSDRVALFGADGSSLGEVRITRHRGRLRITHLGKAGA